MAREVRVSEKCKSEQLGIVTPLSRDGEVRKIIEIFFMIFIPNSMVDGMGCEEASSRLGRCSNGRSEDCGAKCILLSFSSSINVKENVFSPDINLNSKCFK